MVRVLAAALIPILACAARADTPVEASTQYSGRITNEQARSAPKTPYVKGPKEWAKLWKDWKLGKPPAVDWKKQIVLVETSSGSGVTLNATLDDKGDLKTRNLFTADLRTDTGYWFFVVPKKGVKTINGKKPELEKPKAEEP
jgi:hypothetical protein